MSDREALEIGVIHSQEPEFWGVTQSAESIVGHERREQERRPEW